MAVNLCLRTFRFISKCNPSSHFGLVAGSGAKTFLHNMTTISLRAFLPLDGLNFGPRIYSTCKTCCKTSVHIDTGDVLINVQPGQAHHKASFPTDTGLTSATCKQAKHITNRGFLSIQV